MMGAGTLEPRLSRQVDPNRFVIDLAADPARQHVGVHERGAGVTARHRFRPWGIFDDEAEQLLPGHIRNRPVRGDGDGFAGRRVVRYRCRGNRTVNIGAPETSSITVWQEQHRIEHWPWHSYDFDFTSLNLTLPHLCDPESAFRLWRTDFVYEDPPRVAELGEVILEFKDNEQRGGKRARRYTISGAGLANHTGTWWADPDSGLLIEYEIPVGDEPGYSDVRLKFERMEKMSPEQWEAFKQHAVTAAD